MNILKSQSIPFAKVIGDLSKAMGTSFSKSCEEYTLVVPESFGSGTVKGINFSEGIGMILYDCTFKETTEIQFIINEIHPLKFLFCEKGSFHHRLENGGESHDIREFENIIVASAKTEGHILRFEKGQRTCINSIEINREMFLHSMACEIESLDAVLQTLFEDVKAEKMFYYKGSYSFKMANLFSQINSFLGRGFSRNIFLHGNAYNLLSIQILEYQDAQISEDSRSVLLKREMKLVREAVQIIDKNILNFEGVQDLAAEVGLSVIKLQNGFKELYGQTVNTYVQEKRLNEALTLIMTSDESFSEIADKVGISSKSYFSKIFKDRYGLTPSEIRNIK